MDISSYFAMGVVSAIFFMYYQKHLSEVDLVESDVDGRRYLVRNVPDKKDAANLLANLRANLMKLKAHLSKKHKEDIRITRLNNNFKPDNISEGTEDKKYTSYSVNKGEKIVFCIRDRKKKNKKVHELNTVMFVALHELAHIITESVGHTEEFWENFKFLLKEGIEINIYQEVDYRNNPVDYCGMQITDSPLKRGEKGGEDKK